MKNRNITFAIISLPLGLFWLLPLAKAVNPAPDGGYPGGNTAEGLNALLSLTTGGYNTAVGYLSLRSNTTNNLNTAMGAGALLLNAADANTATGAGALLSNTGGYYNTATGVFALSSNTTGYYNTAAGQSALLANTTGANNTAVGSGALIANTTGNENTATGAGSLYSNTTGAQNVASGNGALFNNTIGSNNTAIGYSALSGNNTAPWNTAVGSSALFVNSTGALNTAVGVSALGANTIGSGNVALGSGAGLNVTTANNVICIGTVGNNVDNSCYIGQIFGATSSNGVAVFVNSNGRLGTLTSSRRFKDQIKPMDKASETILALKPVTFRYKKEIDPDGMAQCGLVAEDVEKVNADLVVRDGEGKPYSVRYDQINAMLLNEFLKEHKLVQELKATVQKQASAIAQEQARIDAMAVALQKVSAEIQMNKQAAQLVGAP